EFRRVLFRSRALLAAGLLELGFAGLANGGLCGGDRAGFRLLLDAVGAAVSVRADRGQQVLRDAVLAGRAVHADVDLEGLRVVREAAGDLPHPVVAVDGGAVEADLAAGQLVLLGELLQDGGGDFRVVALDVGHAVDTAVLVGAVAGLGAGGAGDRVCGGAVLVGAVGDGVATGHAGIPLADGDAGGEGDAVDDPPAGLLGGGDGSDAAPGADGGDGDVGLGGGGGGVHRIPLSSRY